MSETQSNEPHGPDFKGPFVGELRDTGLASHNVLREIDGVDGAFVRVGGSERILPPDLIQTVDPESGDNRWEIVEKPKYSPEIHDKYVTGLALFKERSEPPYNIAYARTNAVVAKDPLDNVDKMMLVTEKVTGAPLSEVLKDAADDPALAEQVTGWLDGSSQYLFDKSQAGGDFLFDFSIRQYMYGVTPSEPDKPRIYDIDLDMLFDHFDGMQAAGQQSASAEVNMGGAFIDLSRAINMLDEIGADRAEPVIDTTAAKQRVRRFIDSIPEATQPNLYSMMHSAGEEFPWLNDQNKPAEHI